jgi:hypothetical protein
MRGWYSRPNSRRRTEWTQFHPTQRNKEKNIFFLARRIRLHLSSVAEHLSLDSDAKDHIVAYRPIAGQRSRNGRLQSFLCNRRINKHMVLSNGPQTRSRGNDI